MQLWNYSCHFRLFPLSTHGRQPPELLALPRFCSSVYRQQWMLLKGERARYEPIFKYFILSWLSCYLNFLRVKMRRTYIKGTCLQHCEIFHLWVVNVSNQIRNFWHLYYIKAIPYIDSYDGLHSFTLKLKVVLFSAVMWD